MATANVRREIVIFRDLAVGQHDASRLLQAHADMQAGFSGRVDELRDLHVDVIGSRYLAEVALAPAADLPPGVEIQNVAPWRHVHQSVNLLKAKSIWGEINEVFVFLFGGGRPGCTGIYSLRTFTSENVARETVIAFECLDDALRYAGVLAATMRHAPTVHGITPEQLAEFCMDSGYSCQLEAAGSSLTPPGFNVRVTDWERASRLRSGDYYVLPVDPHEEFAVDGSAQLNAARDKTFSRDLEAPAVAAERSDEPDAASLAPPPNVLENLTPFLTEQVARYYNSPDLFAPPGGDGGLFGGTPSDFDLELARQQLERLW